MQGECKQSMEGTSSNGLMLKLDKIRELSCMLREKLSDLLGVLEPVITPGATKPSLGDSEVAEATESASCRMCDDVTDILNGVDLKITEITARLEL